MLEKSASGYLNSQEKRRCRPSKMTTDKKAYHPKTDDMPVITAIMRTVLYSTRHVRDLQELKLYDQLHSQGTSGWFHHLGCFGIRLIGNSNNSNLIWL